MREVCICQVWAVHVQVIDRLAAGEQVAVCQQLGYSNVLEAAVLDMHYSLRMNYEDEYQVLPLLMPALLSPPCKALFGFPGCQNLGLHLPAAI